MAVDDKISIEIENIINDCEQQIKELEVILDNSEDKNIKE